MALADIVEQGQGGVKPYLCYGQRWNHCGGRENAEQAIGQILKLHTVGRMVNEKLLPAENCKSFFHIHGHITSINVKGGGSLLKESRPVCWFDQ